MIGSLTSHPGRFVLGFVLLLSLGCEEPQAAPPSSGAAPSLAEITARRQPAPSTADVVPTISDTIPGPGSHGTSVASTMRSGGGGPGAARRARERREWNRAFDNWDPESVESRQMAEQLEQLLANARGEDFCERMFNAGTSLGGFGGLPENLSDETNIDSDTFTSLCRQLPARTLRCMEAQLAGEDVRDCRQEFRRVGRGQNAAGMAPGEREDRSVMRRMVEANSVMRADLGRSVMRTDVRDLASRRRHP